MKLLCLLALTLPLFATPCIPNMVVDSQPVSQSCYGGTLTSIPGSTADIFSNDNLFSSQDNDLDANDQWGRAEFNHTGTQVTFTLLGGMTAHVDYWKLAGVVIFYNNQPVGTSVTMDVTPWQLLDLVIVDTFTGGQHPATPNNQNWIIDQKSPVPEPGTAALAGMALTAILICRKLRK